MADKKINELSQIEALDDEALLVVEQGGEAKKMSGAQLRTFAERAAEDAIEPSVEAAQKAAGDAEQAAAEIDPDAINNRIALKGDNLEFDTEEGLLYLTSGGERISDGINVATSGGGGGGGGGESAVFYAIYGTTTFAEIKAAHDAGKAVYMKKGEGRVVYPLITVTNSFAQFAFVAYNGYLRRCTCQDEVLEVWREDESILLAEMPVSTAVTLSASGWNSSSKTQTVTVPGVLTDETKQLITPTPAIASQTDYYNAGIRCTNQAADSLTFTAETVPTEDLTIYVTIQEVSVS